MNLKGIRDAMFAQADYSPSSSPEATSRVNGFINRAYNQLALEAPFLFFESKVHLATEPDVTSKAGKDGVAGDRIQLAGTNTLPGSPGTKDPWTWRTTYTQLQQAATTESFTAWKYDRSWDGRMIEITTADGTKIRNQIRSVWLNASDGYFYFTLVTPWDLVTNGTGTAEIEGFAGFKYRVFTEAYPLPDDVIQLKSARLRDQDINYPLDVFGQDEADQHQLSGPPSQVASGIPRCIFRTHHVHMRGPSVAPVTTLTDLAWLGPEPTGTFEYKVTYTWGKRDVEFQLPGLGSWEGFAQPLTIDSNTPFPSDSTSTGGGNPSANRFRTPRYESPASPASDAITNTTPVKILGSNLFQSVSISLPNITYALGFLNAISGGYSRQSLNQSGLYIRIYRKRTSTSLAQYGELTNDATGLSTSQLDSDSAFYLLAEMRADSTNGGVWYDRGEFLPDYNRRLRDIHGYQTMQFYPKPDNRYVTEIRAVVRPEELVDDEDTPWVNAEAMNVLIQRAMALFYENLGQPQLSQLAYSRYQEQLLTLTKRYGDLRPPNVPVLRRMTRAQSSYRGNRYYRKWYTTSS